MDKSQIVEFIRTIYGSSDYIPLHEPRFSDIEKEYLLNTIDTTFVSSTGEYVNLFEKKLCEYTSSKNAVALVNGSTSLFLALYLMGVKRGDLVITQSFSFVATCNAILQTGARPIFCDISHHGLSLCPLAVEEYLLEYAEKCDGKCIHKFSGKPIKAMLVMHTFGHPANLDSLKKICDDWGIKLLEDAAESLGSTYKDKHTGTFGMYGTMSFNGNKIITTGGGGALLTNSINLARQARHISSTAKLPHAYKFTHDTQAFNFRMPNLNAALGCAQMKSIKNFLESKRQIASWYEEFFRDSEIRFVKEPKYTQSNYWLNAAVFSDAQQCKKFLEFANKNNVNARAAWTPIHKLPMFKSDLKGSLTWTEYYAQRVANLPSSPLRIPNA